MDWIAEKDGRDWARLTRSMDVVLAIGGRFIRSFPPIPDKVMRMGELRSGSELEKDADR